MNGKKVTDIFYPKELDVKEREVMEVEEEEQVRAEKERETTKKKTKVPGSPFFTQKKILVLGIGFLVLIFVFCFFTLSEATINIWPETENVSLKTRLTVDKTVKIPDFSNKAIPGEIFEKEKTITENFPASGKVLKEEKATGTITVYNNYSTLPQIFVANTRFVSSDGKVFRIPDKITVPGSHYEKGKLVPGEIKTKVVADKAGPEYNIGPSTFSIPGLAGTEKYTKFYAKSFEDFTGGLSQEMPQVTKEDLENAKNTLTKQVKKECEAALRAELQSEEISSEFIFLEKAIQTEIVETFTLAKVGDTIDNFNFQAKAVSKTLIFSKENLKNFSQEFILSQVPEGKKLYEKSLNTDFTPETINLNSDKITLSLEVSAKIYSDIDISNLKNNLQGKSLIETKVFLENQPGVTKSEVELWPFWVRSIPKNSEKIKLELRVD